MQVFVAAVAKRKQVCPSTPALPGTISSRATHEISVNTTNIRRINKFRYVGILGKFSLLFCTTYKLNYSNGYDLIKFT
jgi:hypothetical protein